MKNKNAVIVLTILYSMFWFMMLFVIVGFFMIKPVAFYNKISGKNRRYRKHRSSSRYGYSDDEIEDSAMFFDDMDEE